MKYMLTIFTYLEKSLINEFAITITCTSDLWTGCNNAYYICFTAHYIDKK